MEAICIVACFWAETKDGIEVSFVLGIWRIAPITQVSIPLFGLLFELLFWYSVSLRKLNDRDYDLPIKSVTHWTDSVFVLQWLNSADEKQYVFVANRAAEILKSPQLTNENLSEFSWIHLILELVDNHREVIRKWLVNRTFLVEWPSRWLAFTFAALQCGFSLSCEVAVTVNTSMTQEPPIYWNKLRSVSVWVRVIAFCSRLKYRIQSEDSLVEELNRAEEWVFKMIQRASFAELFSEKEKFGKTKKERVYQNLHPSSIKK